MLSRVHKITALGALLAAVAIAAPAPPPPSNVVVERSFAVPTDDGFPNPSASQLSTIEESAGGTLSDAPPPPTLAEGSLTAFQLINFNENFEVAFFSSLIYNITNDVPGFNVAREDRKRDLLNILNAVLAQEELHAIDAANTLNHFGAFQPQPCQYKFPTSTVLDAVALAETFTGIVLGTLQDAQETLATNGDDGPVRDIGSVIGQEGQQSGFYRIILGRVPSEKPFLTASVAAYAFSALQQFIVSCPFSLSEIDIPIFPPVSVISGDGGNDVSPRNQYLAFSADLTGEDTAGSYNGCTGDDCKLFLTYLSGQNLPVSEPITNAQWDGDTVSFDAWFPFDEYVMDGLTLAALTTSGNFSSFDDLPDATLAAPGTIQVNKLVSETVSDDLKL